MTENRVSMHTRITMVSAWVCFSAALAWMAILLSAVGERYLTHAMPFGFMAWVVAIQVRSENSWPMRSHTDGYYLTRFFAFTFLVELAGIWGFVRLRLKSGK